MFPPSIYTTPAPLPTTTTGTRLYYKIVCPPPGIKYFNDFNTYYPSPRYILLVSPLSLLSSYHASRLRRSTKPNLSQDNDISQQDVDTTNTTTTTGTRLYSCPHLYIQPTPPRRREQNYIPVPISIYNQHHHDDGNKIIFLSPSLCTTNTTTTTKTRYFPVHPSLYNDHHDDGNKIPLPLYIYIILFPSSWWSLYREGWTGKYLVFVVVVVMVVRVRTVFVVVVMHTRVIGKYSRCGGSLQDVDHGNMSG